VERRLLAALLAAAVAAAALLALAAALTVTVSYTVLGGVSTGYTPLAYAVEGYVSYPKTLTLSYVGEGFFELSTPPSAGYAALGGVSTAYDPLLYVLNARLELEGVSVPATVRVHVRLLKGGKAYPPDFDIEYTANGTRRVARNGEDSFNVTLTRLVLTAEDPLILEFPQVADGHEIVNSTTVAVDLVPWGAVDVWVYYWAEATQPAKPPSGLPEVPGAPGEAPAPPEEGRPAPEEAPPRGYVFIPPLLYELLREYWWLLLLLLLLLLLALLWLRRRREGVSVEIRIPRWAAP
jgi:hypothetical protein